MKIKYSLLSLAVLSAALVSNASAAVFTGTYDFTGTIGNVASFSYNGTSIPGLTVGNLTKVGVTTSSSNGNSRATAWPTGATTGSDTFSGTVDLGKYFEFTLTAGPEITIDMTSITFGIGRSATGPRQWQWRSSVDSYASTISTYTTVNAGITNSGGVLTNPDSTSTSLTGNILDLSGATYDGLSSITLRLYGFNSEASAGTGGLQGNLSFSGGTVPEPASALLGSLGILGLLRRRRF